MNKQKRIFLVASIALLIIIVGIFVYKGSLVYGIKLPPCMIYFFTGLYCPGCGATRAISSLLHLDFYQAFRYNPLLVILLPLFGGYYLIRAIDYIKTGGNHVDRHIQNKLLIWIFVVVVVYGILRNIDVFPFYLLQPTELIK